MMSVKGLTNKQLKVLYKESEIGFQEAYDALKAAQMTREGQQAIYELRIIKDDARRALADSHNEMLRRGLL